LEAGEYQRRILENQVIKAKIVIKRGAPYAHIYVAQHVSQKETDDPVGVDLGTKKLVVASNGFKKNGGLINAQRRHFLSLKDSLESKGTSSARRRLKRLKRRERRRMKAVFHQSSRGLVQSLEEGSYVVLERLIGTKIKKRGKKDRRHARQSHISSTMGILQHMITYKCEESGIPVVFVRPDFTSQRCPRCGTIDKYNRRTQALFRCVSCGFQHNADFVASVNLRELALGGWAAVSQPYAIPT
jgi:IS605 OrfB family transposase